MAIKFKSGDHVKWMEKNQFVDNPEGKIGRHGMLSVMRTIELTGIVQNRNAVGYDVMVDGRHYTMCVMEDNLKMKK